MKRFRSCRGAWLAVVVGAPVAAGTAVADDPPVVRRATELLEVVRDGSPSRLRHYVESDMHPALRDVGPMELHLDQLGSIGASVGAAELVDVRLLDDHRGAFVLRAADGAAHELTVEVEPIAPYRLLGVRVDDYRPELVVPEFSSLEEAERYLDRLAGSGDFSGVVLVARDGRPDWTRVYGLADRERRIPNTIETAFDVGSITKSLTAVAVLQLVERGRVDLEAPLGTYLKGFPAAIAERVRVIDLLRMRSGFGDYFGPEFFERREKLLEIDDYLEMFRRYELEFEPGTATRYSNAGYVILGGIVEAVTGSTFRDYVAEKIYAPAGMTRSSFRDLRKDDPHHAIGYTRDLGSDDYSDTNRGLLDLRGNPAGGSFSTAGDVVRFHRALRAGRLLKPENVNRVLSHFESDAEAPARFGIAGGAPGVSAVSLEEVDHGVHVVVLSNLDEPLGEQIGQQIFRAVLRPTDAMTAAGVAVPMRVVGHQPAVEVTIDGQGPFSFLVDTGAAGDGRVSPRVATQLGLETVGQVRVSDPSGRNAATRDRVGVGELALGGHVWRDVELVLASDATEIRGIDGILGLGLFGDRLLTLDYPNGELRIDSGSLPEPDGREVLPIELEHGVPSLQLDVAGVPVVADLDSGSMGGLLVPARLAGTLPLAAEPVVVGRGSTSFNTFEIQAAPLDGSVRLGRHELRRPSIEFADLFPRANIGGRVLEAFEVTVDTAGGRVRFRHDGDGPVERAERYRIGAMLAQGPEGMTIQGTVPGTPAERAGLEAGDAVVRINGRRPEELGPGELGELFGSPEELRLEIERQGRTIEVRLTPEKAPS